MLAIPIEPNSQPVHFTTDDDPCPSAQTLANLDNYRAAHQRIQSTLPTAKITPEVKLLCEQLFPPRIRRPNAPRTSRLPQNHPKLPLDPDIVCQALSKLKRGTAFGPFSDYTDIIKSYALYQTHNPNDTQSSPYLPTLIKLLDLILNNNIPRVIQPFFAYNRFLALHKDLDDLTKLRPIGIGTVWRRLIGAIITTTLGSEFSKILITEGQFGVAVKGGIEYLIHTAQAQFDQYITQPSANGASPDRALIILDIVNMFNSVSRDAAREFLQEHQQFHCILPYFDLMYANSNRCYFLTPTGTLDFFTQHEGFPQGDPLATILACLVLHKLLVPLNQSLKERALSRRRIHRFAGDDGQGSLSATSSYIDDCNSFVPYIDLTFFITEFRRLGPPLGIHCNLIKTKILTTITHAPNSTPLSTSNHQHLSDALNLLHGPSSELHNGTRFLGQPLGSHTFCRQYLILAATEFKASVSRLLSRLTDKQTVATLYKYCALPALAHLLAADTIHNTDLTSPTPPSLNNWHSGLSLLLNDTIQQVLSHLTSVPIDKFSALSILLAYNTVKDGGLGFRDHSESTVSSFLIPFTRSLRYATTGIPDSDAKKPNITLPAVYTRHLAPWATSRHPSHIIKVYRHYLPAICTLYNSLRPTEPLNPPTFLSNARLNGLQHQIYHHFINRTLTQATATAPDYIQKNLPSLLSPLTSIALHSLPRSHPDSRLHNDIYTALLRRKLRLPFFDTDAPPICRHCKRECDRYGDHLFSCRYSKIPLHNAIRDTLYVICSTVGPLSGTVRSHHDILLEPTNFIPQFPLLRPADLAVRLKNPTASNSHTLAIDVQITPVPVHLSSRPTSQIPIDINEAHLHSIRLKLKGKIDRRDSTDPLINALNLQHISMIPFTVDHLGGLGYFAHQFLFAPNNAPLLIPITPGSSHFTHAAGQLAFHNALKSPLHLLSRANDEYKSLQPRFGRFGRSHHSSTPQQWALQCLSLNLSNALGAHLHRARAALAASTSTTISPVILGPLFRYSAPQKTLVPGTPRHIPTHT
jgi:hypothetical protein